MAKEFQQHRPRGYTSLGDSRLPRLIDGLTRVLIAVAKDDLVYDTLRLPDQTIARLAHALVECAEDLHHQLGLWHALERYNRDLFDSPLPLTWPNDAPSAPTLADRFNHLLWVLYAEIEPDLILSPTHQDLRRLAVIAADFLGDRLARIRHQSGIKQFLKQRNKYGWDIKRKLIWLGQHSYLFRFSFQNYIAQHGGQADIPTIDDFVCQATTAWSGLGIIDILAGVLPLDEAQQATLRRWYQRHAAYYRVVKSRPNRLELVNIINEEPYSARMDNNGTAFPQGQVVFGSLVPWAGEWYWSGGQHLIGPISETVQQELAEKMQRTAAHIIYRYDKSRLAEAQNMVERQRQHFLDYHGDDLVIYPDGAAMAAAMQVMYQQYNQAMAEAQKTQGANDSPLAPPRFKVSYPAAIMEHENGVGVFFNPDEGVEMMLQFNELISGLKKRGNDLSEGEADALQKFIQSEAISPHFVRRLVRDTGDESITEAFIIRDRRGPIVLDYLLRRYKGHYYRNRYPHVTMVNNE